MTIIIFYYLFIHHIAIALYRVVNEPDLKKKSLGHFPPYIQI